MSKKSLIMLAALILTLFLLGGCVIRFNDGESSLKVWNTNGDPNTIPSEITVSAGSTFSINLQANATTGYSWNAVIEDENIVTLLTSEYTADDTDKVGSGGIATLTFSALEQGETALTLIYAQDWEGGETDKTIGITVIVE